MKTFRAWSRRLKGVFRKGAFERELQDEIESHLQMHIDDNIRAGMSAEEARRVAAMKLGGVEQTKEACRDRATIPLLESVLQDLRFTARQFRKNPAFTFTATAMVALGIAATVTIFTFVDAALIKPLPYQNPSRLLYVTEATPEIPRTMISHLDYLDWKKLNRVFDSLDIYSHGSYALNTAAGTVAVDAASVSDGFFRTLGVRPVVGRDFYPGEDRSSVQPALLLSYGSWQERFGANPAIVGQGLTLDDTPYIIAGVLPENFHFAPVENPEFWTTLQPDDNCDRRRSCHHLQAVGRLKEGVSSDAALADLKRIAKDLESQYPDSNRNQTATVAPLSEVIVGDIKPILLLMMGSAGLLLLIASINVTSLLLVRSETRRRELAVRRALGATRLRLIRQFVIEGVVIVLTGGIAALFSTHWVMQILKGLIPRDMMPGMPYLTNLGSNSHVIIFALVVGAFAVALFSLTPSIRLSTLDVREGMAEAGRGTAGKAWTRIGSKLVVLELTTATVLLVGAGLFAKSLYRLLQVDPGFDTKHLITMRVSAPVPNHANGEQIVALDRRVVDEVKHVPGVASVALTSTLPLSFNGNTLWIRFVGHAYNGEHNEVNERKVSSDYFPTLQASLLRGRAFTDSEDLSKPKVVIINQALAKKYFGNEDPIGQRIGDTDLSPNSIQEIVGIVDDIREAPLDAELWPAIYEPINQSPRANFSVVVRASQGEQSLMPAITDTIRAIDPRIVISNQTMMTERVNSSQSVYLRRSATWLVGTFAAVALLLGVVGMYGVIAYSVTQRTREIGVRIALGARRGMVYELILKEAGVLALTGIIIGIGCAIIAGTLIRKVLFGTPPWDIATFICVVAILGASALLASFFPARRAASVDPMTALRAE
jgi:predicted permease